MPTRSIRILGDDAGQFACDAGDSILAGALRAGLGFPYECNSGGCGACQFELVDGLVEDAWPEAPGISERQRGRGRRLACQSLPVGDCAIKVVLNPALVPPVVPQSRSAWLIGSEPVTADMAEFTFRTDHPALFRPGQYAMLDLPGVTGRRAYSMSNLANDEGLWRFIVKRMAGGMGTSVLFDGLGPGDRIGIDGPFGNSYLRADGDRAIVCIAGGSGLSPVLSILRAIAADASFAGRRVVLFHGGRGPADMCAGDLIASIPGLGDRVELHTAISDDQAPGAADWSGERGFIHDRVAAVLGGDLPAFDYYFCGPPPMTDAVHRLLLIDGKVPADQLHFDRFY